MEYDAKLFTGKIKNGRIFLANIILFVLLLSFIPISIAAEVVVSPSNNTIESGQAFDFYIYLDPKGTPVAGAQLNIVYNKSIIKINNVIEGNLFKQNGAKTFFNSGTITSSGEVINIFDAIIGPNSVSTIDKFLIINATAIGTSGSSGINLSNVKISDPVANRVGLNVTNGSISINIKDFTAPFQTPTSTPPIPLPINDTLVHIVNPTNLTSVENSISFIYPTPEDGTALARNYVEINTIVSNSSTAFIDWDNSLSAWWRFNGDTGESSSLFRDWSNSGQNGVCLGITCPILTSGKFGNALSFDGSNDFINAGSFASDTSGTTLAWINPGGDYMSVQAVMTGLDYFGSDVSSRYSIILKSIDCPSGDWGTTIANGVTFQTICSGQVYNQANFPKGIWKQIAVTYDGSVVNLYLDDILVKTVTQRVSGAGNAQPYAIGRLGGYNKYFFNGKIDDPRIFKRALSHEEIKASYNAGIYGLNRNFTDLPARTYNYRAFAQDLAGSVKETTTRIVTLISIIPDVPTITGFSPQSPVNTKVGNSSAFSINLNQAANVNWYLNGLAVKNTEKGVTRASYTNSSAVQGIWIVNATANNANGSVSKEWIWNVSGVLTEPAPPAPTPSITLVPGSPANDLNKSLIAWWRFNNEPGESSEFFKEWSNGSNNGLCSGSSCPVLTTGKFGNALEFDGINDYVSAGSIASGTSGTALAWINPGGNYFNKQAIIAGLDNIGSDATYKYNIILKSSDCPSGDWGTVIANGNSFQNICSGQLYDPFNFPQGVWKQIAVTYNDSVVNLYLDEKLIKSVRQTVSGAGNAQPYAIGRLGGYSTYYFKGKIDDVRIYSRELSSEEIKASFNAGNLP